MRFEAKKHANGMFRSFSIQCPLSKRLANILPVGASNFIARDVLGNVFRLVFWLIGQAFCFLGLRLPACGSGY